MSRVGLEATGQYHLDLALDEAGFKVMVINPKAAKHFAEALHTRTKTDAVDAAVLAQFALRMPFTPWQRPDDLVLAIRACARRIAALNKLRTQTKNQLHAAQQTTTTPDFLIVELQQSIAHFDAQIEHLRRQVRDLFAADEALQQSFERLISTTGIAAASAIQLLGGLLVLPDNLHARQWLAMADLDPRRHLSGSSVNLMPLLSMAGNRYLPMALYLPALSATRHDPNVRAFYHHLIEIRGLKALHAVCAVLRKLLLATTPGSGRMLCLAAVASILLPIRLPVRSGLYAGVIFCGLGGLSVLLRNRVSTPKARSACAGRAGDNVGVGCVKTLAPVLQEINVPWCVATQHVRSSKPRQIIQDC